MTTAQMAKLPPVFMKGVKVLVYSLALAAAAIHTTLQASHYLPGRELH